MNSAREETKIMHNSTVRFNVFVLSMLLIAAITAGCTSATALGPTPTSQPPIATSLPATPAGTPTETAQLSITPADNGQTITLTVGQTFLLNLGAGYNWDVRIANQAIVSRVVNITVIRGAQGVYEADAAGETKLTAAGAPTCDTTQPGCSPAIQEFQIQIVVLTGSTLLPPASTPAATPPVDIHPTPTAQPTAAYLDDRSDAALVIKSLFNAINLHQYARAYAYWDDTPQRPDFQQFQTGYQATAAVSVTLGTVTGDIGAGQLYASVPVTLMAQTTSGATQTFVGCYILHLSQPAVQGMLPFRPWGIQSADVTQVENSANTVDLMAHACTITGGPLSPTPTTQPGDISAARYIDNRSGPVDVLQSLFNAINRHEYVRAYSYWESLASNLPSLDNFTQGYSATQSITATFGTVTPDAGAGQIHYTVPTTLVAQQTDGTSQTFVGCYVLHISNPDIQAAPPFQPLAIQSATVKQVANDADTPTLMNQLCGRP
jgi:hypothetical protein